VSNQVDTVEHVVEAGGEKVCVKQLEPGFFEQPRKIGALPLGVVEGREGIEPTNLTPESQQRLAKVAADESCGTGHEDACHEGTPIQGW
jgi:hypothetical protein